MVFPVEAEHRAKRRALRLCQDHLRSVMDAFRTTMQLINSFTEEDKTSFKQIYTKVQELGDGVEDSKRAVAQELVSIGAILGNREDFLRFTDITSEVADFCKGIGFRIAHIMERGWYIPLILRKGTLNLSEAVFDTFSQLREAFMMLNYGSPKVLEKAKDVEISEKKVDDLYRGLEITILENEINLPAKLLLKDIIHLLEDTADKIEDASDASRILAFAI